MVTIACITIFVTALRSPCNKKWPWSRFGSKRASAHEALDSDSGPSLSCYDLWLAISEALNPKAFQAFRRLATVWPNLGLSKLKKSIFQK